MKDGISLKNVLNAISWQFSNALLSRDAAQWFQMAETRQKNLPTVISRIFQIKFQQIHFWSFQVLYFHNV